MNTTDLEQVFQHRADQAASVVLDVDALVRRGNGVRRRRMAATAVGVVVAVAAAIVLPISLTWTTGSSATVTTTASPSAPVTSEPQPTPQMTQFPCAGPFLVECGSFPIPTAFAKAVTKAIVDYNGLVYSAQFVDADAAKVAEHFGLNVTTMPAHVYLIQLHGQFTWTGMARPAANPAGTPIWSPPWRPRRPGQGTHRSSTRQATTRPTLPSLGRPSREAPGSSTYRSYRADAQISSNSAWDSG